MQKNSIQGRPINYKNQQKMATKTDIHKRKRRQIPNGQRETYTINQQTKYCSQMYKADDEMDIQQASKELDPIAPHPFQE